MRAYLNEVYILMQKVAPYSIDLKYTIIILQLCVIELSTRSTNSC